MRLPPSRPGEAWAGSRRGGRGVDAVCESLGLDSHGLDRGLALFALSGGWIAVRGEVSEVVDEVLEALELAALHGEESGALLVRALRRRDGGAGAVEREEARVSDESGLD
jgi:hypothetical protein